jgi:acyl dehydratase
MGINPAFEGRTYPPATSYVVGREKLREFAAAVGACDPVHFDAAAARAAGHPDVIATPTFAVLIAQQAELQVYNDPESQIDFGRVVHGEERFVHRRPLAAGDEILATLHIDSVRDAGNLSMMTTRVELATVAGEAVCTAYSTLVVRGK